MGRKNVINKKGLFYAKFFEFEVKTYSPFFWVASSLSILCAFSNILKRTFLLFFSVDDIDKVLNAMEITNSITDMIIEDNRRRHVTVLVSERGTWAEDRNQNNEGLLQV